MGYEDTLKTIILQASNADSWDKAVQEWELVDHMEDETLMTTCVCGREHPKYLFRIQNKVNRNSLFPISANCLKRMERPDLYDAAKVKEEAYRLLHALASHTKLELSSDFFTKKLLYSLYEDGAFAPTKYNKYRGVNDYEFLIEMFNKRNERTEQQQKKINGILAYSVKPYLECTFKKYEPYKYKRQYTKKEGLEIKE